MTPEGKRVGGAVKTVAAFVLLIAIALAASSTASATSASDWGPGFKGCGSFKAGYTIQVFAKGISCSKATKIQKEYWLAPKSRTEEVIPPSGPPEVRLKRFPGWICFSGTGGGSCTKGGKVAAYSDLGSARLVAGAGFDRRPAPAGWTDCGPAVQYSQTGLLAHEVACPKARRVVRGYYRKAQEPHGVYVHVQGFSCSTLPGSRRPIACSRGRQEIRAAEID